jgi:hypothetical protein
MATIQMLGCPKPTNCGSTLSCSVPMTMPMKPSSEPTDRSMCRVTITKTMPVAITATDAVCTDRLKRLRGVR